jgi:regulator of replication initiation timing
MEDSCNKCNGKLDRARDVAECSECRSCFHPTCTRIKTLENFRKLGARKQSWKCDECLSGRVGDSVKDSNTDDVSCMKKMEEMLNSFKVGLTSLINSKFDGLDHKLSELSRTVENMHSSLGQLKTENEGLKKECEYLKQENVTCQNNINELRQYSQIDNLEIVGVPETQHEDVDMVLESIAKVLNIPFKKEEVSIAHRVPAVRGRTKPIICKFVSRAVKLRWLSAAREKRGLRSTDLDPRLPLQEVYINEHLTRTNKVMLGRAREMKKLGRLAFVWVKDGKIFVRESPDSKAKRIMCEGDIASIEKQ